MKKQIFLLPFILLIFSCSQEPQLTELEFQDGAALFEGEPYTGAAKTFYDTENKIVKTNTTFVDGLKESYELFSEQGTPLVNEAYVNNSIVKRTYFVNEEPFITQSFSDNKPTNTTANSLLCESECIVEGLELKDISLSNIKLRNVVFKNADFENISISSKDVEDLDSLSILDTVSFKDSKLTNVSFKDIAFLTKASNTEIQKKICIDKYGLDYPEASMQYCIEDNRYDERDYPDEFARSITFDNVTGKIDFDLKVFDHSWGVALGAIKISNSTIDNFSYSFLGDRSTPQEGTNLIKIENSTINFVDKLILSDEMGKRRDYRKNTDVAYLSIIDDPSAFSCKNSSINDGNLAFILSTCDDFGENLDEFALREYEKTFIPDNTIYRLSRYLENDNYTEVSYSDREYFINEGYGTSDEENQRYAIASGDKDWLMGYLKEVYTYPFAGDDSDLGNNGTFREISPCSDGNLLYFQQSGYLSGVPEECQIDYMDDGSFRSWFYIPESNRSSIADKELELLVYYLDGPYMGYEYKNKLEELKKTKFQNTDFSDEGKRNAIQTFVNDNHNFDGLQNCLRGRHIKGLRESMNLVGEIKQTTENKRDREARASQLMLHSSLKEDEGLQKFSECVLNNLYIYTSQVIEAYKPFSTIARVHREEESIYLDAELRREQELRQQKIAKRKAQFKAFDENGYANFCNVALTSEHAMLINMNRLGNPNAWESTIEYNYKACKDCVFEFYSSRLSDEEFEKLISDESTTLESFNISKDMNLLKCPVAGADRNVKSMYELMMMSVSTN